MRIPIWSRVILSALLVALVAAPAAARPEQQEPPKTKIQKKQPMPQTAAPAQTQTAPAAGQEKGKTKTQTAPGMAGLRAIQGSVTGVFPERHAIIIRTTSNEYQVFVTPQTVLLRDARPVELKQISPGDRVDSCHFNAKNAIQKMSLTSAERIHSTPPLPPPEP